MCYYTQANVVTSFDATIVQYILSGTWFEALASIPAPRLVCIETNPGPPKKGVAKKTKGKAHKSKSSSSGTYSASGIGKSVGAMAGEVAGKLFRTITGFGDYKVSENTLTNGNDPPIFTNGKRATMIRHREYIGDVQGSTAFTAQYALNINPGLSSTFPWLSGIAEEYEQYRIHGLVFEFKTTSATAVSSTNTALGTVILSTQYNANNNPFTDKLHQENYEFAISTIPSQSILHPVECARNQTSVDELYTRTGTPIGTTDLRLYDMGVFQLSTVGMQAGVTNIGELWCTYDVEFLKPKLPLLGNVATDMHMILNTAITSTNYFGATSASYTNGASSQTLIQPLWLSPTTVNLGILPVGSYFFCLQISGSATAITAPGIAFSGTVALNIFENDGNSNRSDAAGTTADKQFVLISFSVLATTPTGNIFTMSGGTIPTGVLGADAFLFGIGLYQ
jgi:hypothetical protein